jgi:hypothetical protein
MPRKPGYTSYSAALDGSEMTRDELEFLLAVATFQKRTGRRFPTLRELLHVAHCLGYRKVAKPTPISKPRPLFTDREEFEARDPKDDPPPDPV